MKIANNILELVGNTPLVRLNTLNKTKATVLAKLEFFNPSGSVKDRAALAMVEAAEAAGTLKKAGSSSSRPAGTRESGSRSSPPSEVIALF